MKDHLDLLKKWFRDGQSVVMARVTKTWGSSPRPVGSVMLINQQGKIAGSVSGGCIEGAVIKKANELFKDHLSRKVNFGVSDDDAWSVGLSCGGKVEVFMQLLSPDQSVWLELTKKLENNQSATLITSLENGISHNTLLLENGNQIGDITSNNLIEAASKAFDERSTRTVQSNTKDYFIHVFPRKPQLLIIGAAHITVDLISLANRHGFETIVIDPRGYFIENTVFSEPPSKLLNAYPSEVLGDFHLDAHTYAVILSHDPKIDDNALEILLPSEVAYIGALGSKKTHAKRVSRLQEKGISQARIDKIHAPIGLDIKAKTPTEIALSIMAQIIETKNAFA